MKLSELHTIIEDEGGGASAGATSSGDIATVSFPLMTRGKNKKARFAAGRKAVGLSGSVTSYIGKGVYEGSGAGIGKKHISPSGVKTNMPPSDEDYEINYGKKGVAAKGIGEAHTLDNNSVIYKLDPTDPMNKTEVMVLGGAGRYTLSSLRNKARKEAQALTTDLQAEHGGSFRSAAYNIKQLTNTLNTIVAAYNELKRIRQKGGRGSRGITDEDANFVREHLETLEQYVIIVSEARGLTANFKTALKEGKLNKMHTDAISGMYHLGIDPGYEMYRWSIHTAGNKGGPDAGLGPKAGPFAFAYTDEEDVMIRNAVKAMGGKIKTLSARGSIESDDVNKVSAIPVLNWKKIH